MHLAVTPAIESADPGWTPVAILTLAIAGFAALAAFGALRQTWRYHPRPVVGFEYSALMGNNDHQAPKWMVRFANRGTADALDVSIATLLVRGGNWGYEEEFAVLRPGDNHYLTLDLSEEVANDQGKFMGDYSLGPVNVKPIRAKLTWRQSPNPKKIRSLEIKLADARVH